MESKNTLELPNDLIQALPDRQFGALLRAFRSDRSETQARLAHRAGISVGHLCELECGKRPPPRAAVFKRLVDSLELTPLQIQQLALLAVTNDLRKGLSRYLPDLSRQLIVQIIRSSTEIDLSKALQIQSILNRPSRQ